MDAPVAFTSHPIRTTLLAALLATLAGLSAQGQLAVTNISYGTLGDNADSTHGGLTFREKFAPVSTVYSPTVGTYGFSGPVASNIYTRRNTGVGNANNTTLFRQTDTGTIAQGTYDATLEDVWKSGNLYDGIRNPFANGAGAVSSNIERFDFYLPNYTVLTGDSLVFFDLENTGNFGDGFRIAAFTGWNTGTAAPTTYANTGLLVAADSFGGPIVSPTGGTAGNFERTTYTNGDNLSGAASGVTALAGPLNLVGILIRLSDLGITAGTTIQGFSIMAADVAPTTAADLVNWNNATFYPTNTAAAGVGNMDFVGFGAQISRPIPEPSTYGLILIAGVIAFVLLRRRQAPAMIPIRVRR